MGIIVEVTIPQYDNIAFELVASAFPVYWHLQLNADDLHPFGDCTGVEETFLCNFLDPRAFILSCFILHLSNTSTIISVVVAVNDRNPIVQPE